MFSGLISLCTIFNLDNYLIPSNKPLIILHLCSEVILGFFLIKLYKVIPSAYYIER
jgi:hypothetical protein